MSPRLAALALLMGLTSGADSPSYSPGTYKYSLLTVIKRSQSVANTELSSTLTADQRMTLSLSAHGDDSLALQLTLTDYSVRSDLPTQLPDVSKMKGTVVMGTMSTAGRLASFSHLSPTTGGADVLSLAQKMSRFLPVLAPESGEATTFTDTTDDKQHSQSGDLTERMITVTTLDGDTTFDGARAFRVRHTTSDLLDGTIVQSGQTLPINSEGTGAGTFYVSERGVYLGARITSTSTSRIKLPDGTIVTLTQDATSTVTLLK
jgi:hypothetical protein